MGSSQSFQTVKPSNKFVKNVSQTIKPIGIQSDQPNVRNRNVVENDRFQQQHTLAKRIQQDKIRFNR